jgi:hypothetical protein
MNKWDEVSLLRKRIDSDVVPHQSVFEGIEWPESEAGVIYWTTCLFTVTQAFALQWPTFTEGPDLENLPEPYQKVFSQPNAPKGKALWQALTDEYGRLQHHHLRLVDRLRFNELAYGQQ